MANVKPLKQQGEGPLFSCSVNTEVNSCDFNVKTCKCSFGVTVSACLTILVKVKCLASVHKHAHRILLTSYL